LFVYAEAHCDFFTSSFTHSLSLINADQIKADLVLWQRAM